jgi:hypothetical protein
LDEKYKALQVQVAENEKLKQEVARLEGMLEEVEYSWKIRFCDRYKVGGT